MEKTYKPRRLLEYIERTDIFKGLWQFDLYAFKM